MGVARGRSAVSVLARHRISRPVLGPHHPHVSGASLPRAGCAGAHWRIFGRALAAVAEHWDVQDAIGIGHSSGGHSTVQAAALRPHTYRALLLIAPTIFPPEYYGTAPPDASFTLRRRNLWASPDEMFERFKGRLPFSRWRPEILRARWRICARLPARRGGVHLSELPRTRVEHLRGGRAGRASRGRDARRQGTAARNLRPGGVAHGAGSGIALCPRARNRAAGSFALYPHGRA